MSLRSRALATAAALTVLLPGCASGDDDAARRPSTTRAALDERLAELSDAGVFVGGVAFTGNLVAIHFDKADAKVSSKMRILVTDGLPDGNAEWFEGAAKSGKFAFASASTKATIKGTIEAFEADGVITLADGVERNFFTRPAGDGAGVFEIKVDANGAWKGKSLDGSTFTAQQRANTVEGAVVSSAGERYPFRHNDLTRRLGYTVQGGSPDTYLTVVTRQATEIQGRGGDVRGGKPSSNIVALDLDQAEKTTAGVFHGRVAFTTDRLNIDVKSNADGTTLVRTYVSDSEPEPEGDIQWFTDTIRGAEFRTTSKTADATITGTIAADGISGELTLPGAPARRYFVAPSGQGSGIYDVVVDKDRRHTGKSEQGGKFDLAYNKGTVMGTLVSPEGDEFPMLGADLAHAFRYDGEFSKPDTYVAFVAPRGRYVFGRNGNVRGGSAGGGIIGLDKKC